MGYTSKQQLFLRFCNATFYEKQTSSKRNAILQWFFFALHSFFLKVGSVFLYNIIKTTPLQKVPKHLTHNLRARAVFSLLF